MIHGNGDQRIALPDDIRKEQANAERIDKVFVRGGGYGDLEGRVDFIKQALQ